MVDCAFVPPFLALKGRPVSWFHACFILRTPLYLMPSMANPNARIETVRREPQLVSSGTCWGVRPLSVFSKPLSVKSRYSCGNLCATEWTLAISSWTHPFSSHHVQLIFIWTVLFLLTSYSALQEVHNNLLWKFPRRQFPGYSWGRSWRVCGHS